MLRAAPSSMSTPWTAPWLPKSPCVACRSTVNPPGTGIAYLGCHTSTLPGSALWADGVAASNTLAFRMNDMKPNVHWGVPPSFVIWTP